MIDISEALRKGLPEEELYLTYFTEQFWTLEQFSALVVGLSPDKFRKVISGEFPSPTKDDLKKVKHAKRVQEMFDQDKRKDLSMIRYREGIMSMSTWRFVKWAVENNPPMTLLFVKSLPFVLKELFFEFQPVNTALRTKSKFSREFHEALYLSKAENLINHSNKKLSRDDIYSHPSMQAVLDSFMGHDGSRVTYKKRTIKDSWLKKIDERKVGRPSKKT